MPDCANTLPVRRGTSRYVALAFIRTTFASRHPLEPPDGFEPPTVGYKPTVLPAKLHGFGALGIEPKRRLKRYSATELQRLKNLEPARGIDHVHAYEACACHLSYIGSGADGESNTRLGSSRTAIPCPPKTKAPDSSSEAGICELWNCAHIPVPPPLFAAVVGVAGVMKIISKT